MLQHTIIKKPLQGSFFQRLTFFEYLYVLVLIFYAGAANTFVRTASLKENTVGFFIPIILSIILAIRWKVLFNNRFYYLILGLGMYFLAISIKYHQIHVTIFLDYFVLFFIVYVVVKALKFNLFKIYEYLLFHLAIIGLIMWVIQFILGGDSLFNLFSKISGIKLFSYVSGAGLNAIIYSVQPFDYNLMNNFDSIIPRNCGYAWEPGAFAVYLCLAIFINLFISKSDNISKIRFWILLSALVTTQSTTGFAMFMVIMIFYYLNKNLNIILLALPVVITGMVFIFSLSFMGNKIVDLGNESNEMDMIVESSIINNEEEEEEEGINPQRFVSFMIAFEDFRNNPILGIGGNQEESWTSKMGANISVISGIGSILAQTGIIGFLFFSILSIKSSFFLSEYFNYKGKFLLFIMIIFISISYSIILLPLIACFWMFSLVEFPKYKTKSYGILHFTE